MSSNSVASVAEWLRRCPATHRVSKRSISLPIPVDTGSSGIGVSPRAFESHRMRLLFFALAYYLSRQQIIFQGGPTPSMSTAANAW